ncbi:MAG: hypothetical protein RR490_06605, partial [Niameybacter sp.]
SFKMNTSGLEKGLSMFEDRADMAVGMFAEISALQLQNDARVNAKWTDRTGAARQRLTGSAGKVAKGYRLTLAHGVDYGIWLELAHEKRFEVIEPVIRFTGTFEIIPGLENLLNKLGG